MKSGAANESPISKHFRCTPLIMNTISKNLHGDNKENKDKSLVKVQSQPDADDMRKENNFSVERKGNSRIIFTSDQKYESNGSTLATVKTKKSESKHGTIDSISSGNVKLDPIKSKFSRSHGKANKLCFNLIKMES
mmetsp:Transcript_32868/g.37644  ORF Transcript_32868/g.37644 Transcript_32868/m.37644 type:complete len:136 (-) Transcript_32868:950-1357(-)